MVGLIIFAVNIHLETLFITQCKGGGLIMRHLKTSFAGNSWPSAVDIPEKAIRTMTSNNDNHFNCFIQKSNYFFLSFCKECLQILACTIKTIFTCGDGIGHNG